MSISNEDLKKLLLNIKEDEQVTVKNVTSQPEEPTASELDDTILRFIQYFGLIRGMQKVPNYVLYYLYRVKYKIYGKKVKLTEFFRHFKKHFEDRRSGNQRYYLIGGLEVTEELKKEYLCDGSNGTNGTNGTNGRDGQDGVNSLLRFSRLEYITECGNAGIVVVSGKDLNKNGMLEAPEIEQSSYLCDGTSEAVESTIVRFIDPCGAHTGFDEVILQMSSGELVAYFEDGGKRFLTILDPGVYQTTDAQKCIFKVTNEMEVVW